MKKQNSDIAFERAVVISGIAILIVLLIASSVSYKTKQDLIPAQKTPLLTTDETIEAVSEETTTVDLTAIEANEAVPKETLYDTLTDHEILLLETTIQHEVGNFSRKYKTYVAEIIYNRLVSEDFPDTIYEVLFQEGQFQGIAFWSNSGIIPDEETKSVVIEVFSKENPSHNCTFYYNPELSDYESMAWFEYSGDVEYVFSHTETNWGVNYETRFFK